MLNLKTLPLLGLAGLLVACGDSNDEPAAPKLAEFEVKIVNATAAQPFSPFTLALHSDSASIWTLGEAASVALEKIAEGGDNSDLLAALEGSVSGAGLIMPGESETIHLSVKADELERFSAVTMLVNTNDAFAGLNSVDVSGWQQGDSMSWMVPLYDAGTEYNSEADGSIPGPADGGTGFDAVRDDVMNKISRHPGLVTQADDPTSVLGPEHRVSGTVATLTLTRVY